MKSKSSLKRLITGIGAFMVAAAFTITGCGTQNSPLGSAAHEHHIHPLQLGSPTGATVATNPVVVTEMISAANGGEIEIESGNFEYSVEFPPGALDQDTEITMTVPVIGEAVVLFHPPMQFNVPVEFEMEVELEEELNDDEADALSSLDVYYYNEATDEWEAQGADIEIDDDEIKAEVDLNHFSQYGLGGYCIIQKACFQQGWGSP